MLNGRKIGNRAKEGGTASRLTLLLALTLMLAGLAPFVSPTPAAAQNINISLSKTVCAPGFDDSGLNLAGLQGSGQCDTPGAGIPFSLVPDNGSPSSVNADASGIVIFSGVTAGTGIIAETAAEMSYSRVFCSVYPTGGSLPGLDTYTEVNATSNVIGYSLNDNESVDCFWFNIPEGGGDDLSIVNVFKYACPEGVDLTGNLIGVCTTAMPDVQFYLYPSDNTEIPGVTDESGFTMFENVPAGVLNLLEVPPDGYQPAAVFCASAPGGSGQTPDPEPIELIDGAMIEHALDPDYYLSCFWYNTPETEQAVVRLTKYGCPEDYDWTNANLEQIYAACETPQTGVHFFLGGPATEIEQVTNEQGQATWNIDPGDYHLRETLPTGYIATRVFCSVNIEGGGTINEMQLSQSSFPVSLGSGDVMDCAVFNLAGVVDAGPASLTINKYTCPAGFDVLAEGADPAECSLGTDDVNFLLDGDAGQLSASTGTGGAPATVKFSDLEAGVYLLTEETPEPIDMAFILSCTSDVRTFNYPFAPFAVIEQGGRIVVQLQPGEDMSCSWYNVLEEQPGTVTITKYWCDGQAGSLTNCAPFAGVINFVLTPTDGGDPITLQTSGSEGAGIVEATGTFEVEEQNFTWCAAESDFVDANGNLLVEPGADVTVEVYNCGPRPLQ
jgi:hypothetical protein